MTIGIKPLENKIVVEVSAPETQTVSGLILPDGAGDKPQDGVVLAVGPGKFESGKRVELDIKVGDRILYSKYGGTEFKHNGKDLLILSARDVLAIVE
jgi:chaperonin GroES